MRHTFKLNIFLLITLSFISNIIFCSVRNRFKQRENPSTRSNFYREPAPIKIDVNQFGITKLLDHYIKIKIETNDTYYLTATTEFVELIRKETTYQAFFLETWKNNNPTKTTEMRAFSLCKETLIRMGILPSE